MPITEIKAKSILRKQKRVDSWFISFGGMNLYRGCTHACAYCDGRNEKYNVTGIFERDIEVKVNAPELLLKELHPGRKSAPVNKGFLLLGGGVNDSYQPCEKKYELTRKALEIAAGYEYPVHIFTKSSLIKRDLDIIKKINEKSKVLVSFSISSSDDEISRIFEPGASPPSERLDTLKFFRDNGINGGIFFMPVIPFVTDIPDVMNNSLKAIKQAGAEYVIFGGMTLKEGKQKEHFLEVLSQYKPDLTLEYENLYRKEKWGNVTQEYSEYHSQTFLELNSQYKIPMRIPAKLFNKTLNENDLVSVILDQLDYLCKIRGYSSPYGYAGYSVSQLDQPVSSLKTLRQLKGVGPVTEKIIKEILCTGTANYYETMLIPK